MIKVLPFFFVTLLFSLPAFAEIPQHKTLKAYQELRLDVCKDLHAEKLGLNTDKNLLKHLEKTFRFLEKKQALAKGRARKLFRASMEEFERLIRDVKRGASHKTQRIDSAFSQGGAALQNLLKDDIKRLEVKAKQGGKVEDPVLTGLDKELRTIEIEDEFATPRLPDEDSQEVDDEEENKKSDLNFSSKDGKAGRIEYDCDILIQEDSRQTLLRRLFS